MLMRLSHDGEVTLGGAGRACVHDRDQDIRRYNNLGGHWPHQPAGLGKDARVDGLASYFRCHSMEHTNRTRPKRPRAAVLLGQCRECCRCNSSSRRSLASASIRQVSSETRNSAGTALGAASRRTRPRRSAVVEVAWERHGVLQWRADPRTGPSLRLAKNRCGAQSSLRCRSNHSVPCTV